MARTTATLSLDSEGRVVAVLENGFQSGDVVEIKHFQESTTVKTLSAQQITFLQLIGDSPGLSAYDLGKVRIGPDRYSYAMGSNAAQSCLVRLKTRGLVEKISDTRPALYQLTETGRLAVEASR